ncbi:MAG: ABC transporter substrate-binding protein [Conexibacter sp.]
MRFKSRLAKPAAKVPERSRPRTGRMLLAALLAVVAVVGALALSACGGSGGGNGDSTTTASGDVPQGGVLRIGTQVLADTVNPFTAVNLGSWAIFTQIYPQLVQYDKDANLVGDFAKSWEFSDRGRTLTFETATNGKWSDGEPLTAEDAAWTINTIVKYQKGPAAGFAAGVKDIASASAPDAGTLVVTFKTPIATALSQLQTLWILPQHVWESKVGTKGKGLREFTNPAPVVSGGSFVMTKYQQDELAIFERNPGYYGPKPNLDGFGLQIFSNPDAVLTALQNDEVDIALGLEAVTAPTLERNPKFKVLRGYNLVWTTFGFNSNEDKKEHPELRDPQVRLAFAHAINVPELIKVTRYGAATPAATQVAAGPFRDESLEPPAYDPDEANRLLDELGYERGGDGIRTADGHPMSYELLVPEGVGAPERKAQMFAKYLKAVGIELKPVVLDNAQYFSTVTGPDWTYMHSDVFLDNWGNYPDPNFALSLMTCEQRGSLSETGYCNPEYDALFAKQGKELDESARRDIVFEMEKILYEDHPYLPLYDEQDTDGWSKAWEGYEPRVGGLVTNLSKQPLEGVHRAAAG